MAPHALEALAAALTAAPRFLSGHLTAGAHGLELDPLAVVADRVIALDVAGPGKLELPAGRLDLEPTPVAAAVAEAWGCLEDAAHSGLLRPPGGFAERLGRAIERLTAVGLEETAAREVLPDLTAPAMCMAPPKRRSFSVMVVLPASGWEMIAKVRRRWISRVSSVIPRG